MSALSKVTPFAYLAMGMRAPRGLGKVMGVSYFLHSSGGLPLRSERTLGEEAIHRGQEALQEEGPRLRSVQAE